MSDELRDLLKQRAENVSVPSDDLGGVVRGGQRRKWRNRLYSAGVAALVGVVAWASVPALLDSLRDEDEAPPPITNTPTPSPTPVEEDKLGRCESVPFRPTYLPEGWSYTLQPGAGGQKGVPINRQIPRALGHYSTFPGAGAYVDVYRYDSYYTLPRGGEGDPIDVLGDKGRSGTVHEGGLTVEFSYGGCDYSLMTYSPPVTMQELRQIAEGLRPADSCHPKPVTGPDANLEDGRHFVYIKGVDVVDHGMGIQFDRAEFLTGDEANETAVAAGAIQEGESVPNDYFIVNQSKRTEALGFADDVEVYIETVSMTGSVGPAPADVYWLACAFAGNDFSDEAHQRSPYWITVRDQEVVKIEEQYLP